MEKTAAKGAMAAGIVILVLATLVMGWFAGRLLPVEPQPRPGDTETALYPSRFSPEVRAERTVDVPFGDALAIDGVTQGDRYLMPSVEQDDPSRPGWLIECGASELRVDKARAVSDEALRELDPAFPVPATSWDAAHIGSDLPGKAFVVTVTARNLSADERAELPEFTLWTDDFNRSSDAMGRGAYPAYGMFEELLANPVERRMTLEPGEARELEVPFYVFRNSFADVRAFEDVDLARFCLEVNDFDPGVCYRFWLA